MSAWAGGEYQVMNAALGLRRLKHYQKNIPDMVCDIRKGLLM